MASWPSNGDVLRIAWRIGGTMTLHCQVRCILLAIRNVGNDALEGVDMIDIFQRRQCRPRKSEYLIRDQGGREGNIMGGSRTDKIKASN